MISNIYQYLFSYEVCKRSANAAKFFLKFVVFLIIFILKSTNKLGMCEIQKHAD